VIHDSIPCDPIQDQGQGHGGLKVEKIAVSKSASCVCMHVIKRLMVNYDTPRTCDRERFISALIARQQ